MKITIARLRSGTNYKEPLHDIMDSFYDLYRRYMEENTQHTYGVYNFGWGHANRKKLDDIPDSDVIIIPSENEFTQHIKNFVDPRHKARSDEMVKQIGEHLANKHVMIWRSDRADNEELYRNKTFKDQPIGKFSTLDEMDIPGGLHGMKYHFITENYPAKLDETRDIDFVYWGTDKRKTTENVDSGDPRHKVFKRIYKEKKLSSYWIGKFSNIERDMKINRMVHILPYLTSGKGTLCFNWMSETATTSRYHEALACGLIPFVWHNYDINNSIVADPWQRVSSVEELYEKYEELNGAKGDLWGQKLMDIEEEYKKNVLKSKDEYYQLFKTRLDKLLEL